MGLLTKDLREGDRVVISRSSEYYNTSSSNPPDSVKGTVRYNGSGSVEWDNGKTNSYGDNDLVKVSETAPIPSGLTKTPIVGKWYTNPSWSRGSLGKFRAIIHGTEFGYSERMYPGDSSTVKLESSWILHEGVRLATESELRTLPKSHPDHPDSSSKSIGVEYIPKTGDRVEIIANRAMSSHRIGDIGIVDKLYSGHCTVKVPGKESSTRNGQYFDDLKLLPAEKTTNTFKEGDTVEIVENESSSCNKVGDIGIVTRVSTNSCNVEVKGRSGGNYHYFTDLKLIPHSPKTSSFNFKAGDKVKIIANTNNHDFSIGATGYLKGTKGAATRGGYYWCVDGIERKVSCNSVRECDIELITGSISSTASDFALGDTVKITNNTNNSNNRIGDVGTIIDRKAFGSRNTWKVKVPGGPSYDIWTRETDMVKVDIGQLVKPASTVSKVWRIKTQQEMISEGLISSGRIRPSSWHSSGDMDQYFGYIVPSHMCPDIEEASSTAYAIPIGMWKFSKSHFTTKPMPWDTSVVKHFDVDSDDDEESEYDDEDDDEQEEESSSWEYKVYESAYDSDLDKLDEMSKGAVREVWFEESPKSFWDDYTPPTKRPKLEVEVIPHKSRKIF